MSTNLNYPDIHKVLSDEGLKVRCEVVGNDYVNRALANGSIEFSRAGQELVTEF